MRRSEWEVTDAKHIEEIIAACPICRLGYADARGAYIVPMNFGYELRDGHYVFYFHSASEGRKIEMMRKNDRAGIEMDIYHPLAERLAKKKQGEACVHYQSVIGTGRISFLEDLESKRHALAKIRQHSSAGKITTVTLSDEKVRSVCLFQLEVDELACKEHR